MENWLGGIYGHTFYLWWVLSVVIYKKNIIYDPKHTDLIQSELTSIISVAMKKDQSCFLIQFELAGVFDPYISFFFV